MTDVKLAKCPRCRKLFTREATLVCPTCQPYEDADYERIADVLAGALDLSVEGVAKKAGVSAACVLRMLDSGRIQVDAAREKAVCGRCGKPAISKRLRLCQACLSKLDQEWAQTVRGMYEALQAKAAPESPQAVHETLQKKRERLTPPSAPPQKGGRAAARRMIAAQRLEKTQEKDK